MAKPAATSPTDTVEAPTTATFDHGGRFVTILAPANSKHETWVRARLADQFGPECPLVVNAINVAELSSESILYVAHPIRVRKKMKDRVGKEVWRRTLDLHLSRPVDVGSEAMESLRRGARVLDYNKLTGVLATVTKNDPAGWFFLPFLSGFTKSDFSHATIQIVNR